MAKTIKEKVFEALAQLHQISGNFPRSAAFFSRHIQNTRQHHLRRDAGMRLANQIFYIFRKPVIAACGLFRCIHPLLNHRPGASAG